MYQPPGAEYIAPSIPTFVPALPQPQRAFFAPTAMPQVPVPGWQIQVPNQPTAGISFLKCFLLLLGVLFIIIIMRSLYTDSYSDWIKQLFIPSEGQSKPAIN